jgi:voltage-gated potassium channel
LVAQAHDAFTRMNSLRRIVEASDTAAGKAFDFAVQALIVVSLITFSVETLPDLSEKTRGLLRLSEIVIVALFTVEYALRVLVAERRLAYIFSFFGLIDLIAIVPFYIASGIDLRALRAFRLLRLVRILKLARYSAAVRRFRVAYDIAREEILLFLAATVILLYLASVGIYYFENAAQPEAFRSVFSSLWWSVSTLTTVGYGDVYPITTGGRIFTMFVLILGLGVVSVPAGLVASAIGKARQLENNND